MRTYGKVVYLDVDYYFTIRSSTGRTLWSLYSSTIEDNGTSLKFNASYFDSGKVPDEFIIGEVLYRNTGKDYDYSGNVALIESIIVEMQKAASYSYSEEARSEYIEGLHKYSVYKETDNHSYSDVKYKGCIDTLNFKTPLCKLESYNEPGSTSVTFVTPTTFKNVKKTSMFGNNTMTDIVKSLGLKTIPQLRVEKDMSWYFNPDGTSKKDYRVIDSMEEFDRLVDVELADVKLASVDIEATGLDFYYSEDPSWLSEMVGFGISWKRNQGVYIPISHEYINSIPLDYVLERLKHFLETCSIITHNGLFDGRVFYHYGVNLNITEDTLQKGFCINPAVQKGLRALKNMTKRRYGHDTLELKDCAKGKSAVTLFKYFPKELTKIYACADVDYTFQLCLDMESELDSGTRKAYMRDISLYKFLIVSEYQGNMVDLELMNKLKDIEERDMRRLEELVYSYVGKKVLLDREYNQLKVIEKLDEDEIKKRLSEFQQTEDYKDARAVFKFSGEELKSVFFDLLGYPITRLTDKGTPSVDKFVKEDLAKVELATPQEWLTEDVMSHVEEITEFKVSDSDKILISANEFNKKAYPVAMVLRKYDILYKRRTGFFNGLSEDNRGGRYYTSNSLAAAETSRIINKIQILAGYLKRLIVPYNKDWYLLVFDFKQIEYRVMAGLAGKTALVERLNGPRADYHREGGAALMGTTPAAMTSDERSDIKAVHFAVPYGMLGYSLAKNLFKTMKPTKKQVEAAELLLAKWYATNVEIKALLDRYREFAAEHGYVRSPSGRKRVFEAGVYTADKIARMAGNYPIQCYAAEIFKVAFMLFREELEERNLADKVITTALVHDEMLNQVHKSVNMYELYEIVLEKCMIVLEGHPKYYAGMAVVDNWYEGKSDLYEAPIEYVEYAVAEYKKGNRNYEWMDNPKEMALKDMYDFLPHLYLEEFKKFQPDICASNIDMREILDKFDDYFLIPQAYYRYKPHFPVDKGDYAGGKKDPDYIKDSLESVLITILLHHFKEPITVHMRSGAIRVCDAETDFEVKPAELQEITWDEDTIEKDLMQLEDIFMQESLEETFDFGEVDYSDSVRIIRNLGELEEQMEFDIRKSVDDNRPLDELCGVKVNTYSLDDLANIACMDGKIYIDITGRNKTQYITKLSEYLRDKSCKPDDLGAYQVVLVHNGKERESETYIRNFSVEELSKILDRVSLNIGV